MKSLALADGADALAGKLLAGDRLSRAGRLGDRLRQRVFARQRQRAGQPKIVRRDFGRIGEGRVRLGQGAGLVEHDRVDLGQALERLAGMEDQPVSEQRPAATAWTAGTARPSAQGQVMMRTVIANEESLLPACSEREPGEERRQRRHMDDRHIELRRAVGEADVGRALLDRPASRPLTSSRKVPLAALRTRTRSAPLRLTVPA